MSGFFRRLRRGKDAPSEEGVGDEEAPSTPESTQGEPTETIYSADYKPVLKSPTPEVRPTPPSPPEMPAPVPSPASVLPPPEAAPAIPSIPPPLPEADRDVNRPIAPRSPSLRCFLCDTDLQGSYCPTCHMTWAE